MKSIGEYEEVLENIKQELKYKFPDYDEDVIDKLHLSMLSYADEKPNQRLVERLNSLNNKVRNNYLNVDSAEIFFIHLYTLIVEMRKSYESSLPLFKYLAENVSINSYISKEEFSKRINFHTQNLETIDNISKLFLEDELILIEYIRNRACHYTTEKYSYSAQSNGKIATNTKSEIIGLQSIDRGKLSSKFLLQKQRLAEQGLELIYYEFCKRISSEIQVLHNLNCVEN